MPSFGSLTKRSVKAYGLTQDCRKSRTVAPRPHYREGNSIEQKQKWMKNPMEHLYEYVYSYVASLIRQVEQGIHEKIRYQYLLRRCPPSGPWQNGVLRRMAWRRTAASPVPTPICSQQRQMSRSGTRAEELGRSRWWYRCVGRLVLLAPAEDKVTVFVPTPVFMEYIIVQYLYKWRCPLKRYVLVIFVLVCWERNMFGRANKTQTLVREVSRSDL